MTDLPYSEPSPKANPPPRRPRRRRRLRAAAIVLGVIVGFFVLRTASSEEGRYLIRNLATLITSGDRPLRGERDDRINILLLGIGGNGHEGPLLADTVLLASFKPSTRQLALVSLPRDLEVPIPGVGRNKINAAYALAEAASPGQGGPVASQVVSAVLGVPVHYYLRLDFAGFVTLIDQLGGITVQVAAPIDDEFYPIPGKEDAPDPERFEHLVIAAGPRTFDGALALKYVRSRKGRGVEGSDFARSRRQMQVLLAIRDRVLSWDTLLHPSRVSNLIGAVREHLDTNLQLWELLRLHGFSQTVAADDVRRAVLDDGPGGALVAGTSAEGAYVLLPRDGDYGVLHAIAASLFASSTPGLVTVARPAVAEIAVARIEIHNGTTVNGLAAKTLDYLDRRGYEVIGIGNAPVQTYQRTVLYAVNPKYATVVTELADIFSAVVFTTPPPAPAGRDGSLRQPYPLREGADVLLIVGNDLTRFPF